MNKNTFIAVVKNSKFGFIIEEIPCTCIAVGINSIVIYGIPEENTKGESIGYVMELASIPINKVVLLKRIR